MKNYKLSLKNRFKKLIFWKNKNKLNGVIDYIGPLTIKGWYKGINKSSEIQLRINNNTVLKTYANEYRKDVCEKFGCEGNFGFSLKLNKEFGDLQINNVSIFAKNGKDKYEELIYKKSISLTQNLIKSIFLNKLYGRDGHVDGIFENKITGWASDLISKKQISIWLHSYSRNNPVEIFCNKFRQDLENKNTNLNCGFSFDLKNFKNIKSGSYLFLSFDKKGTMKLSSENMLVMPNTDLPNNVIELIPNQESFYSNNYFEEKITTSKDEFNHKWIKLKKYNLYINSINQIFENELNKKIKKNSFLLKIKSIFGLY